MGVGRLPSKAEGQLDPGEVTDGRGADPASESGSTSC